uniref:vascular endothelial growth factor C-like n=1 Tax=Oncorhynchus gorbuscha TaxID=8017 RepID=UPI001EAEE99A|nr:vascular endothelial growth factor C-like [Oncorhynchus gorbuscha]
MHLFGISVFLANSAILYANLASESSHEFNHDYYDYDQDQGDAREPSEPDLEQQLRSVASVEELMRIVYPNYYSVLSCRSKRGARFPLRGEHTATETRSSGELPAFASLNPDTLKSIVSEWKKTQCMPREVCLDVGKEFGAATNTFYKPPCVSVYRCGGCCNSEALQCMNISTSYISKTPSASRVCSPHVPGQTSSEESWHESSNEGLQSGASSDVLLSGASSDILHDGLQSGVSSDGLLSGVSSDDLLSGVSSYGLQSGARSEGAQSGDRYESPRTRGATKVGGLAGCSVDLNHGIRKELMSSPVLLLWDLLIPTKGF